MTNKLNTVTQTTIYEKMQLSSVSFVRDSREQRKIRFYEPFDPIKSSMLAAWILELEKHYAPNNETESFMVQDIKNMVQSIAMNLTLEELFYASKLARYGEFGEIESYGVITTKFCAKIITSYKSWKQKIKIDYNINGIKTLDVTKEITKDEQRSIMQSAVKRVKREFSENPTLDTLAGCAHVYDFIRHDLKEFVPTTEQIEKAKAQAKAARINERRDKMRSQGKSENLVRATINAMQAHDAPEAKIKIRLLFEYLKQ